MWPPPRVKSSITVYSTSFTLYYTHNALLSGNHHTILYLWVFVCFSCLNLKCFFFYIPVAPYFVGNGECMLSTGIHNPGLSNLHPCFWPDDPESVLKSYFDFSLSCVSDIRGTEWSGLTLSTVLSSSKIILSLKPSRPLCFIGSLPLLKSLTFTVFLTAPWVAHPSH